MLNFLVSRSFESTKWGHNEAHFVFIASSSKVHSFLRQCCVQSWVYQNKVLQLMDRFREKYLVLINWRLRKQWFKIEWILSITCLVPISKFWVASRFLCFQYIREPVLSNSLKCWKQKNVKIENLGIDSYRIYCVVTNFLACCAKFLFFRHFKVKAEKPFNTDRFY